MLIADGSCVMAVGCREWLMLERRPSVAVISSAMKRLTIYFAFVFLFALFLGAAQAQTFEVAEASIADLQRAMTDGRTTSKALVQFYPKSEEEMMLAGKAFREAGFKTKIQIDNEKNARKRRIYLLLRK